MKNIGHLFVRLFVISLLTFSYFSTIVSLFAAGAAPFLRLRLRLRLRANRFGGSGSGSGSDQNVSAPAAPAPAPAPAPHPWYIPIMSSVLEKITIRNAFKRLLKHLKQAISNELLGAIRKAKVTTDDVDNDTFLETAYLAQNVNVS